MLPGLDEHASLLPDYALYAVALQYYTSNGLLLAKSHQAYWMGLTADLWPFFYWTDNVTPSGCFQQHTQLCPARLLHLLHPLATVCKLI